MFKSFLRKIFPPITRRWHKFYFVKRNRHVKIIGQGYIAKTVCNVPKSSSLSVEIAVGSSISNCNFNCIGKNNKIVIGKYVNLQNITFTFEGDNNKILIGDSTTMEGNVEFCACESNTIIVGNNCMLSHNISIRTTDSHSICTLDGRRINRGQSVLIGNHVWIGCQVLVLKGSLIPDECIIGARSIITSNLKAKTNTIIAGSPAKVVKEAVCWTRDKI